MANPRHVFRAEGNAWLQQLEDQIVLGPSHVFEYIKTDGYKRLVDEEKFTSFFTIFTSIKQRILHDYDGDRHMTMWMFYIMEVCSHIQNL